MSNAYHRSGEVRARLSRRWNKVTDQRSREDMARRRTTMVSGGRPWLQVEAGLLEGGRREFGGAEFDACLVDPESLEEPCHGVLGNDADCAVCGDDAGATV